MMQFTRGSLFEASDTLHGRRVLITKKFLEPLEQLWIFTAEEDIGFSLTPLLALKLPFQLSLIAFSVNTQLNKVLNKSSTLHSCFSFSYHTYS